MVNLARTCLKPSGSLAFLSDQYFSDLLVWYHLVWLGETVRRADPVVRRLIDLGIGYSYADRCALLALIGDLIASIVPRYRRLAQRGQVELSVTPYGHPILPLLLDFKSAHEAQPDAPLPAAAQYPGGFERARWHIREGLACFERHFGFRPAGCWPAEGAISDTAMQLLGESGFRWTASGQGVLTHSLRASDRDPSQAYHRPYRLNDQNPTLFFRDDTLSDLIGFTYASWHADDAVGDLLHRLLDIRARLQNTSDAVVSIILDGENAWEHYPENAYYFLSALYTRLAEHPEIELSTFSSVIETGSQAQPLPQLVAGSWVYGTLSTWIGEVDKNRAWDQLVQAKQDYDQALLTQRLAPQRTEAAALQLGICEASDWFWWYGDYNPADAVQEFDELYRHQLRALYEMIETPAPAGLDAPLGLGHGAPEAGGTMRRGQEPV